MDSTCEPAKDLDQLKRQGENVKEMIRVCENIAAVNATAVHYARVVAALEASKDVDARASAIHIKNLAKWRRMAITAEEKDRNGKA